MTSMSTTIVTVSYNSSEVLEPLLESCPADTPVVVVDNASRDVEDTRDICARFGAELIENSDNLGFGVACNMGAARAETEFILFINPDARLAVHTLDALLATARTHPEASAFNPIVKNDAGRPALKRKSVLVPKAEYMSREVPECDLEIPTLNGSAFLVRREAFEKIQGFDPGIFLFFEDDDLGERLRRDCGPLMLSVAADMTHTGGNASSGPRLEGETFKSWHMGYSKLYVMRKHGLPWARVRAIGAAILRVISPTLLWSNIRRAKRIAFLRGTWAALKQS